MLDENPDISSVKSNIWGTPMVVAVRLHDDAMVRKFAQHGARWEHSEQSATELVCIEDAVRSPNAKTLIYALFERPHYVNLHWMRNFGPAVNVAIDLDKEEIARMLIDSHPHPLGSRKFGYGIWARKVLTAACRKKMEKLVLRLIEVAGWDGKKVGGEDALKSFLLDMCKDVDDSGLSTMVKVLLTSGMRITSATEC
jgi:hypothetical protein